VIDSIGTTVSQPKKRRHFSISPAGFIDRGDGDLFHVSCHTIPLSKIVRREGEIVCKAAELAVLGCAEAPWRGWWYPPLHRFSARKPTQGWGTRQVERGRVGFVVSQEVDGTPREAVYAAILAASSSRWSSEQQ
jgi:hypothetical protein